MGRSVALVASVLLGSLFASAVALVAMSAVPEEARAAFPGENSRIAFDARVPEEASTNQIYTIKPDGTGEKQLTDTSSRSFNVTPSYSPEGTKIAWERNGDIWIMNADGTDRYRLTTGLADDGSPAFSPDGTKLAFSRYDPESGRRDIYTKVLGGARKRITNDMASEGGPVFSPDGTKIAFTRSAAVRGCSGCYYTSELAIVRHDGTGLKVITNTPGADEASAPDWSPNGRRLVFQHYLNATEVNRIETIRADGTGLPRTIFSPRNLHASDPVFSPDGTKVAFRYSLGDDIWTIKTDGTEPTNVTNTPGRWESSPDWRPVPIATTMR